MSLKSYTAVWTESKAQGQQLLLLLAIADRADDNGENAWPTMAELSARARLTTKAVRGHLQQLVKMGELIIHKNAGGDVNCRADRRPNLYTVVLPSLIPRGEENDPPTLRGSHGGKNTAERGSHSGAKSSHIHPSYTFNTGNQKNNSQKPVETAPFCEKCGCSTTCVCDLISS